VVDPLSMPLWPLQNERLWTSQLTFAEASLSNVY